MWSPSIATVGAILSVDARKLRRNLALEDNTFLEIRSRFRYHLSIRLLLTTDLSIKIIAAQTGFAEPNDFARAFMGWSQISPSGYREKYKDNKQLVAKYI